MANYSLVVGSKFSPFSYQELLQPALMATQAHQEIENQYAELATKASVWEKLANDARDKDSKAYQTYKQFSNDLNSLADNLSKEGLDSTSRRSALNMLSRYSSDITPIEEAYKRRQELTNSQLELLAKDNTLMFDRDASLLKLDDLIKNPNLTYKSYSGATLAKQVGTAASALAKEIRNNPNQFKSILGGQYFQTMTQKGYTTEEILLAASRDKNAPKELKNIVDNAIYSSGIASWGDDRLLQRAYDYANQGLWNAMGDIDYQTVSNKNYLTPEQSAKLQKEKEVNSRLPYRAVPRTKVEDLPTTKMGEDLKYVKGLKDGSIPMNEMRYRESGYKIPVKDINPFTLKYQNNDQQKYNYTEEQLKRLKDTYGTNNLDELEKIIQSQINESAIRDFTYSMNYPDNKLVSKVLSENSQIMSRNGKLPIYELNEDKNIKGKQLSSDDLSNINFDNGILDYDPTLGLRFIYTNKDGETKKVVLDTEVLDNKDRRLASYQEELNKARINKDYDSMNKLIYLYMSQLDGTFNSLAKIQSNTDSNLNIR